MLDRITKPASYKSTWRDYQAGLKKSSAKKRFKKKVIIYSPLFSILLAVIYAAIAGMSGAACRNNLPRYNSTTANDFEKVEKNNFIKKKEVQIALNKTPFTNLTTLSALLTEVLRLSSILNRLTSSLRKASGSDISFFTILLTLQ